MLTVQKLWQNQNLGSLTSIFGYNFPQNLRSIELSQAKRLSYLLELFCWHILARFKENPRINAAAFAKTGKNLKKAAVLRFLHFLPPTSCRVSKKSTGNQLGMQYKNSHTDSVSAINRSKSSFASRKSAFMTSLTSKFLGGEFFFYFSSR